MEEIDETQKLQNKVDRVKALNLIANAHNLTPPVQRNDDDNKEIAIVSALKSEPRLMTLYLKMRGLAFNQYTREIEQVRKPYMNVEGAYLLVDCCSLIAQEGEWSNFDQDNVNAYIDHFYEENLPYFTFWHDDYDLNPKDFPIVMNALKMFALSTFNKAKGGKYINAITRTYSEGFLDKALNSQQQQKKEGMLGFSNPFKKLG